MSQLLSIQTLIQTGRIETGIDLGLTDIQMDIAKSEFEYWLNVFSRTGSKIAGSQARFRFQVTQSLKLQRRLNER